VHTPIISAAALTGNADPIAANDPLAVALDLPLSFSGEEAKVGAGRKRITFEELVSEDDIDIPDFMR